jgi:hypothetical protein
MNRSLALSLATLAAAAASFTSTPARADAASDGVVCPANTEATLQGGVLSCKVTLVFERASVCPPVNFANYLNIRIAHRDSCEPVGLAINDKASVPSAMAPVGGPPKMKGQSGIPADVLAYLSVVRSALDAPDNSAFDRVVNPTGSDTFVAEKTVHVWPKDFPATHMVGHQPSRGVACPNDFDPVSIAGGRGLRCEQKVVRNAACDAAWVIERDVDDKKDACFLNLPIGRTKGNYTIPAGTTGLTGHPSRDGWSLRVEGGADKWEKKQFRVAEGR